MNPGDLPPGILDNAAMFSQIVSFLVGAISALAFTLSVSWRF